MEKNFPSQSFDIVTVFERHSEVGYKIKGDVELSTTFNFAGSRGASTEEMLETENNRMVDDLAAKVSRLKGVRGFSCVFYCTTAGFLLHHCG